MNEPSVEFFCLVLEHLGTRFCNRIADPVILEIIRSKLGEIESLYTTMEISHFGGKSE